MKIGDIKEEGKVNMEVKVIYDQMPQKTFRGRKSKTVIVADIDSERGGPTALVDLFDDDIDKYQQFSKMKVVNCFAKIIKTKRGEQPLITYGFEGNNLIGHYEELIE